MFLSILYYQINAALVNIFWWGFFKEYKNEISLTDLKILNDSVSIYSYGYSPVNIS